ncbi:hypothetical protein TSAR_004232 [Trichomalopsis sarcophagae]|uniref:Nanos-type domain-containing protein n=1 Tax=Trichomalopsis sarcophagae TaxID=543379 RepID=A0A232EQA3_9HYME|nr:hypothetical protein TSAR_004232 [Trichomalopsis sarcophagae]
MNNARQGSCSGAKGPSGVRGRLLYVSGALKCLQVRCQGCDKPGVTVKTCPNYLRYERKGG